MAKYYFELINSPHLTEPWRWRAKSYGNHEILAWSEPYHNKQDCIDSMVIIGNGWSYEPYEDNVKSFAKAFFEGSDGPEGAVRGQHGVIEVFLLGT